MIGANERNSVMKTMLSDTNIEPRWQTYFKAMLFVLPAVIAWQFACVFLVPKLLVVCRDAHLDPWAYGWLIGLPLFLVQYGGLIGIALILVLALMEFFASGWAGRRHVAVGVVVWFVNVAVLFGLTGLIIILLIAAPSLSHAK